MISFFLPSVTSLCVSSLKIEFSRHLLVGFIRFFVIFQIFGRKIFSLLLAKKNSIFGFFRGQWLYFWVRIFQRAMAIFLSPVFTVSLEMLMFLHWWMEKNSIERRAVIFFATLPASFRQKKRNFFNFFETDLIFPIAHCVSQIWRSFSTKAFVRSVCLSLSCKLYWQSSNWPGPKFSVAENFSPASFGENIWRPKFFHTASVTLSHFSGLISHVWNPNAGYGM